MAVESSKAKESGGRQKALEQIQKGIDTIAKAFHITEGGFGAEFGVFRDDDCGNIYPNDPIVLRLPNRVFVIDPDKFEEERAIRGDFDIDRGFLNVSYNVAVKMERAILDDTANRRLETMTELHGFEYNARTNAAIKILTIVGTAEMLEIEDSAWDDISVRCLSQMIVKDANRVNEFLPEFMTDEKLVTHTDVAKYVFDKDGDFTDYTTYFTSQVPEEVVRGNDVSKKNRLQDVMGDVIACILLSKKGKTIKDIKDYLFDFYGELLNFKMMQEENVPRIKRKWEGGVEIEIEETKEK